MSDFVLLIIIVGAPGDDFFALGIIKNYTYLLYNLGGGVASVRSVRQIDPSRKWHLIVAGRTGRSGYMYIDNQPAVNVLSPGVLVGLDAYTPLYIGGVPDFSKLPSIVRAYFNSGFIGTIYEASFRTAGTSFTALLTNATGTGTPGLNGVAVERGLNIGDDVVNECSPNPCKNNGTCSQKGKQVDFVCLGVEIINYTWQSYTTLFELTTSCDKIFVPPPLQILCYLRFFTHISLD